VRRGRLFVVRNRGQQVEWTSVSVTLPPSGGQPCLFASVSGLKRETHPLACWSLPLGEVSWTIFPAAAAGGCLGRAVLPKLFHASSGRGTIKSGNCNPTTLEPGTRRRLVLLQTFTTQDFDELADALPRWDLRCRQLGRGPFRGQFQVLQLGRIQVFRIAANRMLHFAGWPPPGCFGSAPVLAANETAIWRGRRLKAGQVRVLVPGQEGGHVTAAHGYQLVGLVLDGALVREAEPVLGGGDLEKRLAGTEAVTTSPAGCRALGAHLVGVLDLAQARPDLLAPPGQLLEQECLGRFLALLACPHPD